MKLKIDWSTLGKQLWDAVKPVLLAAIGGGIVAFTGCSAMSTPTRGQTTEIVAVGIPAVAWISHTAQDAEHNGNDANTNSDVRTNDVSVTTSAGLNL